MEQLIPVINQLQEVFSTSGSNFELIQLPQIIVVGDQSAGKSSVLESLVGRTCLPRGKGIVTRCPIVLQLVKTTCGNHGAKLSVWCRRHDGYVVDGGEYSDDDYCEFPHLPKGKNIIRDFNQIVEVINLEVDNRAGTNKGIINRELIMRIYSQNVINLTVVDLPGMVKNPTGDQPKDIEKQVEDLIRIYIGNPNSIILAVSTATNDIATSGSLKLAKEVDPEFKRTIAVITKLDLMDHGTNATELLTGDVLKVKLGIFGVVNRSFEDIENNTTIEDSIQREAEFLNENYPEIACKNGSPYLKSKLQSILLEHIQRCLPQLQAQISNLRKQATDEMKTVGEIAPINKSSVLRKIIEKFCETFKAAITGRSFRNIERKFVTGAARLKLIFESGLKNKLNSVNPLETLKDAWILNTIANSTALESGVVVPEVALQDLIREQICMLQDPVVDYAAHVHEEMLSILDDCMKSLDVEMRRFPGVKSAIVKVVTDLLQRQYEVAEKELSKYVEFQASFITMNQVGFSNEIKGFQKLIVQKCRKKNELLLNSSKRNDGKSAESSQNLYKFGSDDPSMRKTDDLACKQFRPDYEAQNDLDNRPKRESDTQAQDIKDGCEVTVIVASGDPKDPQIKCEMMRKIVSKYFEIVKTDVRNFWPKVMYNTLMYYMEQNIHESLIEKLYTKETIENLVVEDVLIAERRNRISQQLKELQKADKIVSVIRDTTF